MDTNNGKPFRFATAIMYLNATGPGGGGETVFPVDDAVADGDDDCYEAALFGEGLSHTGDGTNPRAKDLLDLGHAATRGESGLAIAPQRGLMVLFYTRTRTGEIDPCSWHGGCAVHPSSCGKWTAQKFFEVPPKYRRGADNQGWDPCHTPLRMFCHRTIPCPRGADDVDDDPFDSDGFSDDDDNNKANHRPANDRGHAKAPPPDDDLVLGGGSDDECAAYRAAMPQPPLDDSALDAYDADEDGDPDDAAPPFYGETW